ncbi:MAG TPA: tetratricopeptide repeat protein [Candidatus Acidoferrum sp.]|nr:tetratricopeptide repeat protein [Candidatus Acidoferrum sp.]
MYAEPITRSQGSSANQLLGFRWVVRLTFMAAAVLFVFSAQLKGQTAPSVNEKFREATEAMQAGRLDEAADGFSSVTKTAPTFAEAFLNLGLVRSEQGHNEEAISNFEKALVLKPHLRGANLFLGVAEFRLNHPDKAIMAIKKETSAFPRDANAWMWLGVAELVNEQPELAADALDKAAKLAPNDIDILYHRGRAHLLVSKNSYEKMFKVDPHSWRVHQVLGQMAAEAERHEDAIAQYFAAIKLAPTQPGLHEELAGEYHASARMPEAEAAYRQELEIDPHNVVARYKLGVLLVGIHEAAKGKALIEGALREKPGLADADYNLGRAEMMLGNDAGAADYLKRATSQDSDFEIIQQAWYQLGIVYRRLHRTEEAQQAMATFQKLKEAEATDLRQTLSKYRTKQDPNGSEPPPGPEKPR